MWKWLSIVLMVIILLLVFGEGREEFAERFRYRGEKMAGSLLLHSSAGGRDRMTRALIYAGAEIETRDACGATPLALAASGGHFSTVGMLIQAGAHLESADRWGNTPLFRAADGGDPMVIRTLLEAGADPGRENMYGWRPFEVARYRGFEQAATLLHVEEEEEELTGAEAGG